MSKLITANLAVKVSTTSEENIIAEIVDSKHLLASNSFYRVICGTCSKNTAYVAGYGDIKVRVCDVCYRRYTAYKVTSHNVIKSSVFSSYFGKEEAKKYS